MKYTNLKIFLGLLTVVLFTSGCSLTKTFSADDPIPSSVKKKGYARKIERVAVIIKISTGQVNSKAANYLSEALSDMFFERGITFEIIIDDYKVSGEDVGQSLDDFGPDHILTVLRTDTGNFDVDLYDYQEDLEVWNVQIISDLNDIPVEVADKIFVTIREQLTKKNLI